MEEEKIEDMEIEFGNFVLTEEDHFNSSFQLEQKDIVKMEKNYEDLYDSLSISIGKEIPK